MATREQLIEDFADHKYATGEKFERLINSMKVVQEPVETPAASGTSLSFIDSIEQDKDGKITATKKTLDLSNAHELNPFKGWYKTGDTLPTDGFDGAYLYFKDTTQSPAVTTIYQWNGTTYADTGTVVDESNVNTFGSGQAVNAVKIKNESGGEVTGDADVLSAEAGDRLWKKLNGNGVSFEQEFTTSTTTPGVDVRINDFVGYEGRTIKIKILSDQSFGPGLSAIRLNFCSAFTSGGIISHASISVDGTETEATVPEGTTKLWLYNGAASQQSATATLAIEIEPTVNGLIQDVAQLKNKTNSLDNRVSDVEDSVEQLITDVDALKTDSRIQVIFEENSTILKIKKYQDGKLFEYTFKPFGANSLWQLFSVRIYQGGNEIYSKSVVTDSVGPYQVSATNDADGDNSNPPLFTGGCHGYNGDQTGSSTAFTIDIKVFADGKTISENTNCSKVTLEVTNKIQGWNTRKQDGTGRVIIQERVRYSLSVEDDDIHITNEITALEDVTISLYYGLQIAFPRESVRYISKAKSAWSSSDSEYTGNDINAVESKESSGLHQLMYIYPVGLGYFYYKSASLSNAFHSANSKAYYRLIQGNNLQLSSGESVMFKGGYCFTFDVDILKSGTQSVSAGDSSVQIFIPVDDIRGKNVNIKIDWNSDEVTYFALYQSTTKYSSGIISGTLISGIHPSDINELTIQDTANWIWITANNLTVTQGFDVDWMVYEKK